MDTGSSASSTLGLGGERAGERDPLALAAGQLVRVLAQELLAGREPHLLQQGGDLARHLLAPPALVQPHRALQVIAHGVHRVQRGERVLEDELDLALVPPERAAAGHVDRLAVEPDRTGGEPLLPGEQPGGRRLARPALADQRDDGAAVEVEGDVAHRVQDLAAAEPEVLAERDRLHGERPACRGRGRQRLLGSMFLARRLGCRSGARPWSPLGGGALVFPGARTGRPSRARGPGTWRPAAAPCRRSCTRLCRTRSAAGTGSRGAGDAGQAESRGCRPARGAVRAARETS